MFFLFLSLLVQLRCHCMFLDTCSEKGHSTEDTYFFFPHPISLSMSSFMKTLWNDFQVILRNEKTRSDRGSLL